MILLDVERALSARLFLYKIRRVDYSLRLHLLFAIIEEGIEVVWSWSETAVEQVEVIIVGGHGVSCFARGVCVASEHALFDHCPEYRVFLSSLELRPEGCRPVLQVGIRLSMRSSCNTARFLNATRD